MEACAISNNDTVNSVAHLLQVGYKHWSEFDFSFKVSIQTGYTNKEADHSNSHSRYSEKWKKKPRKITRFACLLRDVYHVCHLASQAATRAHTPRTRTIQTTREHHTAQHTLRSRTQHTTHACHAHAKHVHHARRFTCMLHKLLQKVNSVVSPSF